MLTRRDVLLLVGAAIVIAGGALFLNPANNEPMWAEWLLGPALVYVGLPVVIIGIAVHYYRVSKNSEDTKNAAATPNAHR